MPIRCTSLNSVLYFMATTLCASQIKAVVKFWRRSSRDRGHQSVERPMNWVDPQIVRIPKVHQYFVDNEHRGYIVMDSVDSKSLRTAR